MFDKQYLSGETEKRAAAGIDRRRPDGYITAKQSEATIIQGVSMIRCFDRTQIPLTARAFNEAEMLVCRHFRLSDGDLRENRYDVKTLAFLQAHEVKDGAFAHLCKYTYEKPGVDGAGGFDFYRVCLQDNIILDAVDRAASFVKLAPLMLYIAAHELIHVLRFGSGMSDFDAPGEEKEREEKIVHFLTRSALQTVRHNDLDIVFDCFSSGFSIGDICN